MQAVLSDRPVLIWIANSYDIDDAYGADRKQNAAVAAPALRRGAPQEQPAPHGHAGSTPLTPPRPLVIPLPSFPAVSGPLLDDPQAFAFRADDDLRFLVNPEITRMRVRRGYRREGWWYLSAVQAPWARKQ